MESRVFALSCRVQDRSMEEEVFYLTSHLELGPSFAVCVLCTSATHCKNPQYLHCLSCYIMARAYDRKPLYSFAPQHLKSKLSIRWWGQVCFFLFKRLNSMTGRYYAISIASSQLTVMAHCFGTNIHAIPFLCN